MIVLPSREYCTSLLPSSSVSNVIAPYPIRICSPSNAPSHLWRTSPPPGERISSCSGPQAATTTHSKSCPPHMSPGFCGPEPTLEEDRKSASQLDGLTNIHPYSPACPV